ncbi:MAG TPA: RuBisCO large subunit C-terminal-like domain-containing protein, partial [Candidatus Dormibacteraeota bacterium]|nr:RuBisCO large subunit C-terminal-like domain-containing protein [Candidatus Dormibacteraeota bacterium]
VEAALARVADGTGWRPLYAPNITTRTDRIVDQARRAIEAGARALTVTFVSSNLEALWCLAASDEVAVPIYAHCTGKEIFTGAPGDSRGIAPAVLARLVRLLGGDIMRLSAVDGDLVYSDRPTMAAMHRAMTDDALARPAMLPVVSGALNPGNVHRSLAVTGPRVLLLAGRALVGHPEGPAAGVRAFRAAVEAFLEPNPDAKPPTGGAIPS